MCLQSHVVTGTSVGGQVHISIFGCTIIIDKTVNRRLVIPFLFKPGYGYLNEKREERTHQSLDVSADPCSRRCVCRRTGSCTRGYKSPHSRRHTTDTQHSRCQQPRSCRGDSCLGLRGRPLQPLEGLIKGI